jgi:hypothetical protein
MSDQSRRVPADRGLSGLGLIMQLSGSLFGAITALYGVIALIELSRVSRYERSDSSLLLYALLLAGSGVTRSLLHRQAGVDLIFGSQPFQSVKRYLIAAIVNTCAWLFVASTKMHAPAEMMVILISALLAWPVVLTVALNLPAFRSMADRVPTGEDKGFEGASLLMLIFGTLGLIATGLALYMMWQLPAGARSSGPFILGVISLLVLLVRSGIHVSAALTGLRETRLDLAVGAVNRYGDFGVIASFVAGGCFLLAVMTEAMSVEALIGISCMVWMLLAWPLTIRRFFSERQFADMMANEGNAGEHRRAPDLGLTTLGWFLLAGAVVALSMRLPMVLLLPSDSQDLSSMGNGAGPLFALLGGMAGKSPWFGIGVSALQLWAGIELIRMSELHRIAATAFGVAAGAVSIYEAWPLLSNLGLVLHGGPEGVVALAVIAIALLIPGITIFAANRSHVPAATARYTSGA